VPVQAVTLSRMQRQVRGLNLKRSKRWLTSFPGIGGPYEMPHIDRLGRFTGASVYTLTCEPADVLSITVSTIFGRLKRYAHAHNERRVVGKHLRVLLRVAAYYALSKNSYYMDRILCFVRNLSKYGKHIHPITLHFLAKGDEDKRFVYSQVCYQTNWLIFRVCKRPRDKLPLLKSFGLTNPSLFRRGTVSPTARVRSNVTGLAESVATVGRPNGN
jgi:hypothetical protein